MFHKGRNVNLIKVAGFFERFFSYFKNDGLVKTQTAIL